ncbi:hypothetical protein B4N89_03750 [Embleya scabrispora]|uniref:LemA family protein n=1 Tax=Embleya scabrispora TaxID=159449 RepID=A0A1T3NU21_9ACTN|nr:hypothetical protein [Embleya scabrispora]OPC80182.1 hypothetical protein B4N89_03750 [Embleya scabrispora]
MMTVIWILLAVLAVGVYLSWTAGRLDRLHARVDSSRAALDAQLLRRSAVAQEIATSGLLDPASSLVLAGAAHEARNAAEEEREVAESDLTRALRILFEDPAQADDLRARPGGEELVAELQTAVRRVPMARRFHNDAVRGARAVRRHRLVRYLRLAGHAPYPVTFEMDDEEPRTLQPGGS